MGKKEALKFFKCYKSDVSCIDCEFKEPCNVFVYVKQQVELDIEKRIKWLKENLDIPLDLKDHIFSKIDTAFSKKKNES